MSTVTKHPDKVNGEAWCLGDYIDADGIIPVRYCTRPTPENLVKNCLTQIEPTFPVIAQRGLILVAGKDFGRGSANENSVRALMLSGVRGVIASSFGPLFFRNAINMGLPVMVCPEMVKLARSGDKLEMDFLKWRCIIASSAITKQAKPVSEIEMGIIRAGGMVNWIKGNQIASSPI